MVKGSAYIRIGLLPVLSQGTCLMLWFLGHHMLSWSYLVHSFIVCHVSCYCLPASSNSCILGLYQYISSPHVVCMCHVYVHFHVTPYPMMDCNCMNYCVTDMTQVC